MAYGMDTKSGAGVIPFAVRRGVVLFLFHKTFSGSRAGHLVDFGGGGRAGETYIQTAAREFVEETDAMFLADSGNADFGHGYESQYRLMQRLIENTQQQHPGWFCTRAGKHRDRPRNWKTFFAEVDYRGPAGMNRAWAQDTSGRFRKRRELVWLTAGQLLDFIDNRPEGLWKRIRQYEGLREVVTSIAGDLT